MLPNQVDLVQTDFCKRRRVGLYPLLQEEEEVEGDPRREQRRGAGEYHFPI